MTRPLVIDANLCVLWVLGTLDPRLVGSHKGLKEYESRDFEALIEIVARAPRVMLCPHVLTETSNLARRIDRSRREQVSIIIQLFVSRFGEAPAESGPSMRRAEYRRLGLTDAVLLELSSGNANLLTADLDLYLAAAQAGYRAVNFNHLRDRHFQHDW